MSEPRTMPAFRLKAKLKNGHQGYPFDIGAGWPKDKGQGFNLSLQPGVRIILADGTELTTGRDGNCWMDIYDNRDDMDQRHDGSVRPRASATVRPRPAPPPTDVPLPGDDGDDDIPF